VAGTANSDVALVTGPVRRMGDGRDLSRVARVLVAIGLRVVSKDGKEEGEDGQDGRLREGLD
jgi:hypothetical protein